jgi:hypothetical protein
MKESERYIKTINWAICFTGSEKTLKKFLLNEIRKISPEKSLELKNSNSVSIKKELMKLFS